MDRQLMEPACGRFTSFSWCVQALDRAMTSVADFRMTMIGFD